MNRASHYALVVAGACCALTAEFAYGQAAIQRASAGAGSIAAATASDMGRLSGTVQFAQLRAVPAYDRIEIMRPGNDSTVFDNSGNVEVSVAVTPGLRASSGDRIVLLLDGRRASLSRSAQIKLTGVERGDHTLVAQVLDSGGNAAISSAPVKFHLWQASRLFPGRSAK